MVAPTVVLWKVEVPEVRSTLLVASFFVVPAVLALCPDVAKLEQRLQKLDHHLRNLDEAGIWPPELLQYPEALDLARTETNLLFNQARTLLRLASMYRRSYDGTKDYLDREYFSRKMDFYFEQHKLHLQRQKTSLDALVRKLTKRTAITRKRPDQVSEGEENAGGAQPGTERAVASAELDEEVPVEPLDLKALNDLLSKLQLQSGDILVDDREQALRTFQMEEVQKIGQLTRNGQHAQAALLYGELRNALSRTVIGKAFCQLKMERLMARLSQQKREEEFVDALLKISETFNSGDFTRANTLLNSIFQSLR